MPVIDVWVFFAGLALFVYSVRKLEESIKLLAGRAFKKFIQRQTAHPLKAILVGVVSTALLQGSSVVLMITLSFVGAGVLSLKNALALVLGSNLGTTLDSWLIAWLGFRFDVESWSYVLLAFSLPGMLLFSNNRIVVQWTRVFVSFSMLFIGLAYMKKALLPDDAVFILGTIKDVSPFWFVPVGFLLTVVIQSSFASMAIALSALHAHQFTLEHATAIAVGAELGTSVKFLIAPSKGSQDTLRVAWGNFCFNIISMAAGILLLYPMLHVIHTRLFPNDPLLAVVCFISFLNFLLIVICYPFLGKITRWLEANVTRREQNNDYAQFATASSGDHSAFFKVIEREIGVLFDAAVKLNKRALRIGDHPVDQGKGTFYRLRQWLPEGSPFADEYKSLKLRQGEQLEHCAELMQGEMAPAEVEYLDKLVRVLRNITHSAKNIKNIRANIKELSDSANDHLFNELNLIQARERGFYEVLKGLSENSFSDAQAVEARLADNGTEHEKVIQHTMELLRGKLIAEAEASTLLNVHRELYSSHKALLEVIRDLKLNHR